MKLYPFEMPIVEETVLLDYSNAAECKGKSKK